MSNEEAQIVIKILEELKGQPKEVVAERITKELANRGKLALVPKKDPPKRVAQMKLNGRQKLP